MLSFLPVLRPLLVFGTMETADEFEVTGGNAEVSCLALSRRFGSVFVLGSSDGIVCVYNIGSTEPLLWLQTQEPLGKVLAISFDDSEEQLCVVHESGEVCIWDLDSELLARTWKIDKSVLSAKATAATIHPSGRVLALASGSQIQLWDIRNHALAIVYPLTAEHNPTPASLLFSPDGLHLVCGGRGGTLIFDLERGVLARTLSDPSDADGSITALSFHPFEPLLVTGSSSGKLALFDFTTFAPLDLPTHQNSPSAPIAQVSWSFDGACLMALSSEHLLLWNSRRTHAIQAAEMLAIDGPLARTALVSFGFDSYAIVLTFDDKLLSTCYYNLQSLGLLHHSASSPSSEAKREKQNLASAPISEPEPIEPSENDTLFAQLMNSKNLYKLRNRLDHLKSLRATWSGKSAPSILISVSKQPSAVRAELLGELISARIIETALNISPATVSPTGLATQTNEDFGTFLLLLKQNLKNMTAHHQLAALNYIAQLIPDLSLVCPEKFDAIQDEVVRLSNEGTAPVSSKAKEVLAALAS